MRRIECEQRSAEWFAIRQGRVTASSIADVTAFLKNGNESEARKKYKLTLAAERLSGSVADRFVSPAMSWGIDHESDALAAYTARLDRTVEHVGFVLHPTLDWAGCSPDGLVGEHGLLEIKCPTLTTHLDYRLKGEVPPEYIPQIQWQMACTERKWCDFVSYDPRYPQPLDLFVKRMERDDACIALLEQHVTAFLSEVDSIVQELTAKEAVAA